jgi:hypothetical protein
MVGDASPMAREFERCDGEPLALGDVLVYRSDTRKDGHVVMVIDAPNRIAWGSHGFDGRVRESLTADTGVEYQKIKRKPDWKRWDRPDMEEKACWRHRAIAAEAAGLAAHPPELSLRDACDERRRCGRPER